MTNDLDLLRQFARENSQDAFGEIVRRHVNLVYSAALRQVRSPHLAEDVTQSVFADLAQHARKLKPDTILTAWLYAVARRTAIDAVRKESRRQLREQISVEMNNMNATADDWAQIAPLLDDAMATLDETDRTAILLRYFENKSLRDVGASLNISDDAAQKRVSRALESLREFFTKQRLAVGAGAFAVLISANAVKAAPATLAGTILKTTVSTMPTIGMTMIHKILIAGLTTAAVATSLYAFHSQSQAKSLLQQDATLNGQIAQLQRQLDDATNQLENLQEQNEQLQSGQQELLRLRSDVTRLRNQQTAPDSGSQADTNHFPKRFLTINVKSKFVSLPSDDVPVLGVVWTSSKQHIRTGLLSAEQYKAITEALQGASDASLIGAPQVTTADGREAALSETRPTPVGDTNVNVGIELDVVPDYSTNSSLFTLAYKAKLTVLTSDASQPGFDSISLASQLAVSPGQTAVLEAQIPPGARIWDPTNAPTDAQSLLIFVTPSLPAR
ncbi:MAG TPA: sigma-70 family RNA polymerase sigma factor [Candidatus Sulfotelmatobacter sp.]|nr:sigma-70 family RNA polymerase sigma factor [Candidatus Sulfotelmatobacter sp.]